MELTSSQAGAAIGMTNQAVRDHVKAGRLPVRKHGVRGLLKISVADLRAFALQFGYVVNEEYLSRLAIQE